MTVDFKTLDSANWLEIDPTMAFWGITSLHLPEEAARAASLIDAILEPRLSSAVPAEIVSLYRAAQGAMCYGCLFYPLFALATQQMLRVADSAAAHQSQIVRPDARRRALGLHLRVLEGAGLLDSETAMKWKGLRDLRNITTHAKWQESWTPAMALDVTWMVAALTNQLFDRPAP